MCFQCYEGRTVLEFPYRIGAHICRRVDERVVVGGLCMCYSQKVNVKRENTHGEREKRVKKKIKIEH